MIPGVCIKRNVTPTILCLFIQRVTNFHPTWWRCCCVAWLPKIVPILRTDINKVHDLTQQQYIVLRQRHSHLPIAKQLVKPDNHVYFVHRKQSSLDIWLEIIQPPHSTAFPASIQACKSKLRINEYFFEASSLVDILCLLCSYSQTPETILDAHI